MGETSSQKQPDTSITPGIAADRLKKVALGYSIRNAEAGDAGFKPSEELVVRVRKNQQTVAFTLNTKRMAERREIERANEARRRSGR
jgi:hypothetical protein